MSTLAWLAVAVLVSTACPKLDENGEPLHATVKVYNGTTKYLKDVVMYYEDGHVAYHGLAIGATVTWTNVTAGDIDVEGLDSSGTSVATKHGNVDPGETLQLNLGNL